MKTNQAENTNTPFWKWTITTSVLICLLILESIAIGYDSYQKATKQLEPKSLVAEAEKVIRKNYPQAKQSLIEETEKRAPEIAEELANRMMRSLPGLRKEIDRLAGQRIDAGLDKLTALSAERFRQFLQENRQEVIEILKQLKETPEKSEELALQLETQMDDYLGIQLQAKARQLAETQQSLNKRLETLNQGTALTPKQLMEQRILRILRAMEEKHLQDNK